MSELAFLILKLLAGAPEPDEWHDPDFCDDGASPWRHGRPNFACRIDGCTSKGPICGSDRLAHCYDETGADLGVCALATDECHSKFSCFEMWLYCDGTYECHDPGWVGCNHGSCESDTSPAAPDDILVAEQISAAWSGAVEP